MMEEQGTCPICNKEISLKILNAHVNDHLDNDPFEETINSTYEPPLLNLFSLIKGDKDDSDKKKDSDDKEEEEESEYDKEKEDEDKEDEDNGFEVICPYPGCGKLIGQKVFPSHVFSVHNNEENHSHICPICELMGEEFKPGPGGCNLKAHLQKMHNKSIAEARETNILRTLASMERERVLSKRVHETGNDSNNDSNSSSISDSDDDDNNNLCLNFFGEGKGNPPTGAEVSAVPADVTVEEREKPWEETEREIVEKTIHIVLERDMDDSEACVICLDNLRKGQKLTILGCLCKFHEGCYNDYMASKPPNACPVHHKE